MGNYASCALTTTTKNKAIKVILPSGEIKQYQQPTKAVELMLEVPNHFLVNSKTLQIGKRILALNADEDLEMGNVYVMFGMKRVNSFVTTTDMGAIFLAAKRGANNNNARKVRVVPAAYTFEGDSPARVKKQPAVKSEVEELFSEFAHGMSFCRSKKPVLETIVEEPISSR